MNNLDLANEIVKVSQQMMMEEEVLTLAQKIIAGVYSGSSVDEIGQMMFDYSSSLTASVGTAVAFTCLGEEKFGEMTNAVMENEFNKFINSLGIGE